MGHLPFLVAHGRAISIALVAGGGALGVAAMQLVRKRSEVNRIERLRTRRVNAVTALAAGAATIRGRLRGRAATAYTYEGMLARERSDELLLDVEGTHVALRGDVEVLGGTHVTTSWHGTPPGFAGNIEKGGWHAYELRDGDEVIATGTLANVAGSTDAAYRDAAGGWILEPTPKSEGIELFAATPAARPRALHPAGVGVFGAIVAAVTYLVLWGIGAQLVDHHPAIAAAFPHVRDAALDELERDLEYNAPHTDEILAQRFELADMRRGCKARARLEGEEERYDAELADACGDADATIDALAHLGRFKEALAAMKAQHTSWPSRKGTIALAAGDWNAAADAAQDLVRRMAADPPSGDQTYHQLAIAGTICYAQWFRAKGGDAKAAAALATLGPDNVKCMVARAMLLPPEQRGAALAAAGQPKDESQLSAAVAAKTIAWAYGLEDRNWVTHDMYDTIRTLVSDQTELSRAWLSTLALSVRAQDASDRGIALACAAVLDAVRGDFDRAKARGAEAATKAGEDGDDITAVRHAVALHTSEPIAVEPAHYEHPATEPLVKLRAGSIPTSLHLIENDGSDFSGPLRAALDGDGGGLAIAIERGQPQWEADSGTLLAIAPLVHQHRAELATAVRNFRNRLDGIAVDKLPFELLAQGATHRDLAALLGDAATAKHWQQLIDAQLPVLDDPDRVIALLLWQAD